MKGYMVDKIKPCRCGDNGISMVISSWLNGWWVGCDHSYAFRNSGVYYGGMLTTKYHKHAYQAINEWNTLQGGSDG